MPSPFPGMDPFIETTRMWSDFHADLATEARAVLNRVIQPKYYATAVTYVTYDVVEIARSRIRSVSPDVGVWHKEQRAATPSATSVIDPPPVQSRVRLEAPMRLANVEVREAGTDVLVTAIEILSPANKRSGPDREKYQRKRREMLRGDLHVMELDLLRGGHRSSLETSVPDAAYYVTLCRADSRPDADVWPIQLDMRLPVVPVPLSAPDPDTPLDLGAIVGEIYERGGYATRIDYRQPVPPPTLSPDQEVWVAELLAAS